MLLGLGALAVSGCSTRGRTRRVHDASVRGVHSLLRAQTPAGLFPSATYGLLKSGQSLTPFVADVLLDLPPKARPTGAIQRAMEAMASLQTDGAMGLSTLPVDYPTYATGLALRVWARAGYDPAPQDAALGWLTKHQLTAAHGWAGHPAQGGWAMGAATPPTAPNAGHVDLSMTRRALGGLIAYGLTPDHVAIQEGRGFVARCQAPGGGFVYSPVELALNKGGCEGTVCAGYGSATADGLLAALATGVGADDPLIAKNLDYLRGIHATDRNPGIGPGPLQGFSKAMTGYYRAGASRVFDRLGGPAGWRQAMIDAVLADQRPDGSWSNPEFLQKEDDPIIATALALAALTWAAR